MGHLGLPERGESQKKGVWLPLTNYEAIEFDSTQTVFSKFLKMVLFSSSRNGLKGEIIRCYKVFFNKVLFLMDDNHSFSGTSYHSSHACLSVICRSNHSLSFVLFFKSKDMTYFMGLYVFKYVCMWISIYVAMFALPTSQNPLEGFFNDDTF